jgi:hypothetical protein
VIRFKNRCFQSFRNLNQAIIVDGSAGGDEEGRTGCSATPEDCHGGVTIPQGAAGFTLPLSLPQLPSLRRSLEILPEQLQLDTARSLPAPKVCALEAFLIAVEAESRGALL